MKLVPEEKPGCITQLDRVQGWFLKVYFFDEHIPHLLDGDINSRTHDMEWRKMQELDDELAEVCLPSLHAIFLQSFIET
jgi:hypothetical protein